MLTRFSLVFLWLTTGSVGQLIAQNPVNPGQYRAVLKTAGGDLPFGLDIQPGKAANTFTVFALNGTERLPMDVATLTGDTLRIPMAIFESELVARVSGETLTGYWKRRRITGPAQMLPLTAQHGSTFRFVPDMTDKQTVDVSGKYATVFRSRDGKDSSVAVGVFAQTGNRVTGTFLTPTGDYRYLDGNVIGDSLKLSTFDGSHLFLFKAKRQANGLLTGTFNSGVAGFETWTARPDANAALPDANKLTYLKPGFSTLDFSFPEPNGKLVSLKDERFRGKVVVVQLLGTWCPNCMDETNFLSPWYKKNRQRGVEVVGLAFETTADPAIAGPKIERMKTRFGLDYPVALAGTNNKTEAAKSLPALNRVVAFPTTIFIDKKGVVRQIHTGFSGPGTGRYYDQFVEEFGLLIDKLARE